MGTATGSPDITKTFHHRQVDTLTLAFQGIALEGTPGHRLGVYTAEPGTPNHDAVLLLDMTTPETAAQPQAHTGNQTS
ncbi:hypothetical protein ACEZCY_16540 [Streptacidiphilus sp. N1-12]|uniref:MmyB-like transcription regulator ligand binding domain-containing protein n=2 Tax=Streptacidiphilus alkalitolerans TaxID=3342712 RepID=A0ABV6VAJ4_9ACTN